MPKRADANQAEIVAYLRAYGIQVIDLHECGKGVPDLLVVSPRNNIIVLLEIKAVGCDLNEREREFHEAFTGPIGVAHDAAEALAIIRYYDDLRAEF